MEKQPPTVVGKEAVIGLRSSSRSQAPTLWMVPSSVGASLSPQIAPLSEEVLDLPGNARRIPRHLVPTYRVQILITARSVVSNQMWLSFTHSWVLRPMSQQLLSVLGRHKKSYYVIQDHGSPKLSVYPRYRVDTSSTGLIRAGCRTGTASEAP